MIANVHTLERIKTSRIISTSPVEQYSQCVHSNVIYNRSVDSAIPIRNLPCEDFWAFNCEVPRSGFVRLRQRVPNLAYDEIDDILFLNSVDVCYPLSISTMDFPEMAWLGYCSR